MLTGIQRTLTIGAPMEELVESWCAPDVPARVFAHTATLPGADDGDPGAAAEAERWTFEVVERDATGVRWRSHGDGGDHLGTLALRPAPGDWGTEATLRLDAVDGGALPSALTSAAAIEALHRFKSLVETGEIPTLDRNPHARLTGRDPH